MRYTARSPTAEAAWGQQIEGVREIHVILTLVVCPSVMSFWYPLWTDFAGDVF